MQVKTTVDGFNGRNRELRPAMVGINYAVQPDRLVLNISSPGGSFDIDVSCVVHDGEIRGNTQSEPVATPAVGVGVLGGVLEIDPSYETQVEECLKVFLKLWQEQEKPFRKPRPGDPPDPLGGPTDQDVARLTQPRSSTSGCARSSVGHVRPSPSFHETRPCRHVRSLLSDVPTVGTRLSWEEVEHHMADRLSAGADQDHLRGEAPTLSASE